jgi:hypothetical protein
LIDGRRITDVTDERDRAFGISIGHAAPRERGNESAFIEKRSTDLVADAARRTRHEHDRALKVEVHDERIGRSGAGDKGA